MSQTITAIYADGVLQPLTPLKLPEQTEIELEVRRVAKPEEDERSRVLRALADAGVIINKPYEPSPPSPISTEEIDERSQIHQALVAAGLTPENPANPQPAAPLSAEERERIGRVFAVGKPLSEIIIEEREGR